MRNIFSNLSSGQHYLSNDFKKFLQIWSVKKKEFVRRKKNPPEHKFSVTFVSKVGTIIIINDSCNCHMKWQSFKNNHSLSGLDLVFSRGGGVSKNSKFLSTFFSGRANCFPELFQSTKNTLFWLISLRCSQNLKKKRAKSGVFTHVLENAYQKITLFWRALTSKLVYIGAKGALECF